jgi:hypothetical protein
MGDFADSHADNAVQNTTIRRANTTIRGGGSWQAGVLARTLLQYSEAGKVHAALAGSGAA